MSSIKMVALRKHPFGTGERDKGEEYLATADEASILTALKWAEPVKEAQSKADVDPPAERKYLDLSASDRKRSYQRRDMKARD